MSFNHWNRFSISIGSIGNATEPWVSTNSLQMTDIWLWQFLHPSCRRWYEYEIVIDVCTYNTHDLEQERWLFGDVVDHVGIYESKVAEGVYVLLLLRLWQVIRSFFSQTNTRPQINIDLTSIWHCCLSWLVDHSWSLGESGAGSPSREAWGGRRQATAPGRQPGGHSSSWGKNIELLYFQIIVHWYVFMMVNWWC